MWIDILMISMFRKQKHWKGKLLFAFHKLNEQNPVKKFIHEEVL